MWPRVRNQKSTQSLSSWTLLLLLPCAAPCPGASSSSSSRLTKKAGRRTTRLPVRQRSSEALRSSCCTIDRTPPTSLPDGSGIIDYDEFRKIFQADAEPLKPALKRQKSSNAIMEKTKMAANRVSERASRVSFRSKGGATAADWKDFDALEC